MGAIAPIIAVGAMLAGAMFGGMGSSPPPAPPPIMPPPAPPPVAPLPQAPQAPLPSDEPTKSTVDTEAEQRARQDEIQRQNDMARRRRTGTQTSLTGIDDSTTSVVSKKSLLGE